MRQATSRRRFLAGALGTVAVAASGPASAGRRRAAPFAPEVNGYGFRNWTPQTQYFETPPGPPGAAVREQVRTGWRDQARRVLDLDTDEFSPPLVDAVATQLRLALVHLAGTNGYCYGMVLTAQHYYEDPTAIPVDTRVASEIEDPTAPVDDPATPVYDGIVEAQADQFLRFRAWLGRRAMVHPNWLDTAAVLRDLGSVIDAFGTAAVSLFNERLLGHQVLAYDYVEEGGRILVPIYDPNRAAVSYEGNRPTLEFVRRDDGVSMRPYGRYTGLLFNQFDQIERATDREDVGPLDHLTVDRSTVRSSMFPLALVLTTSPKVDLTVVDPDGEEFERLRSIHMDVSRGGYSRIRSRYGARPGRYRVSVFGKSAAEYTVTAKVAGLDGVGVDEARTATIRPGELHAYALRIRDDGSGTFGRVERRSADPAVVGAAGAVGGLAAGAIGYRALQRRLDDTG